MATASYGLGTSVSLSVKEKKPHPQAPLQLGKSPRNMLTSVPWPPPWGCWPCLPTSGRAPWSPKDQTISPSPLKAIWVNGSPEPAPHPVSSESSAHLAPAHPGPQHSPRNCGVLRPGTSEESAGQRHLLHAQDPSRDIKWLVKLNIEKHASN
jgi:hypothetical protein